MERYWNWNLKFKKRASSGQDKSTQHWSRNKTLIQSSSAPHLPFFWRNTIILLKVTQMSYISCILSLLRFLFCGLICSSTDSSVLALAMPTPSKTEICSSCLHPIHLLFWFLLGWCAWSPPLPVHPIHDLWMLCLGLKPPLLSVLGTGSIILASFYVAHPVFIGCRWTVGLVFFSWIEDLPLYPWFPISLFLPTVFFLFPTRH